jgi:hypothetical protein
MTRGRIIRRWVLVLWRQKACSYGNDNDKVGRFAVLNGCMSHHGMHDSQLDACSIQPKKGWLAFRTWV